MEKGLIVVKQLPVIEENLRSMTAKVTERTQIAMSLVCTEDNLKEIRKTRTALNKEFEEFEAMRTAVRRDILAPYDSFNNTYKTCIGNSYTEAISKLDGKIKEAEAEIKKVRQTELQAYFNEYRTSLGIGKFASLSDAKINITLSASKKSLHDAAKAFLDKVRTDLNLIETQGEHKDEILVEYEKNLDVSKSITTVLERVKAVEAKRIKEAESLQKKAEPKPEKAPAPLSAPTPATPVQVEKTYRFAFTVYGDMEKLKQLKQFLDNGGYQYERITDHRA